MPSSPEPNFWPNDDWHPETQSDGRLGPPGRKPPTAIATATPRPPRRPHHPARGRRLTRKQRVARLFLSAAFVISGAATASLLWSIPGIVLGTGLGGLGAIVAIRLLRSNRERRVLSLH